MVNFKDFVEFYKLAKNRNKSNQDYFKFEAFQSEIVIKELKKKLIDFKGKKILDIGSGRGGYSHKLFEEGAYVISLDITKEYFQKTGDINFVLGNALKMPFRPNTFDFVFCSSLIEHVKYPELLIKEVKRILKKGGMCYLSFPPFWSPVGAHQFKPFHYLGEKMAVILSRKFYRVRSFRYDDFYGKLHIRTIRQVKNILIKSKLEIKSITTRMSPVNFAKIPAFNELLTWHVEFLVEK